MIRGNSYVLDEEGSFVRIKTVYDERFRDAIKALGARWIKDCRCWEISVDNKARALQIINAIWPDEQSQEYHP